MCPTASDRNSCLPGFILKQNILTLGTKQQLHSGTHAVSSGPWDSLWLCLLPRGQQCRFSLF